MGEWFTSFDDAWSSFLARSEPLESVLRRVSGGPVVARRRSGSIVPPPRDQARGAAPAGRARGRSGARGRAAALLSRLAPSDDGPDLEPLLELGPFALQLGRGRTASTTAVVAEVESPGLDRRGRAGHLPAASLARVRRQTARGRRPGPRGARPAAESSRSGRFIVDELVRVRAARGQDDGPPAVDRGRARFTAAIRSRACRSSSTRRFACSGRTRSRERWGRPSCSGSPRSSTERGSPTSRSPAAASSTARSGVAWRAPGSGSGRSRRGSRPRSGSRCAAASSSAPGPSTASSHGASSRPRPRTGSTSSGCTTR